MLWRLVMDVKLLKRAAEVLPKCRTLSDAEEYLGGEWADQHRDAAKAAVT